MRSFQTIGDELPRPGTVTFQSAVVCDHLSVYWPGATWPWPEGPRHRGQYFAPSPTTSIIRTSTEAADSTEIPRATESTEITDRAVCFIVPILHFQSVASLDKMGGCTFGFWPWRAPRSPSLPARLRHWKSSRPP